MPVRELELRAGVVFEGVPEESRDFEQEPRRVHGLAPEPRVELHQSRVRVHRVWGVKAGGLRKDAVVFLMWSPEDKCFGMKAGTRYVFFTEPTGDAAVLRALSPPVQSKRAVRKDVTHALCPTCGKQCLSRARLHSGSLETIKLSPQTLFGGLLLPD